ncbi:hypothetical protein BWQ96_07070 [Gracilariopsis chorda]|uniref:Uncharacterized protein n=1 Tax=Gracilariopsis chorda TaxID=448386 RepID=A0A2V3IM84_9FLOR|nr:hypothetical protein BWQ96_07070 [Gracilariopsis chorda]|eukprot:PXF43195.1 hypothetical protein BWQ96_07070 [Gracilariopsis chorda]
MIDVVGPDYATDDETSSGNHQSTFFSTMVTGEPARDIGQKNAEGPQRSSDLQLHSDEQSGLNEIYAAIRNEQVTRRKMDCAPQWILERAVAEII